MKTRFAGVSLVVVLAHLGCGYQTTLNRWLLCGDCLNNEREAAADVGWVGVGYLGVRLRGLDDRQRANLQRQFAESYRAIVSYRGEPPPLFSDPAYVEYVSRLVANADASYRKRAATTLADISERSPYAAAMARPYLLAVLRDHASGADTLRDDVFHTIVAALATNAYPRSLSTVVDSEVVFLDTVTVLRSGGAPPWDTSAVDVVLAGAPFPNLLRTGRWADSIRFLAVGPPATYSVLLEHAGPGGRTDRAAVTIVAAPYTVHDSGSAPPIPVTPGGEQRFLVLRPAAPVDHFRLLLSEARRVVMRVEWFAAGPISLDDVPSMAMDVVACGGSDPIPPVAVPGLDVLIPPVEGEWVPGVIQGADGLESIASGWFLDGGCWVIRVTSANLTALVRLSLRSIP